MLNDAEINKLSNLAKLELDDAVKVVPNLVKILDLISQINQVDTANIKPMDHALDVSQPMRADVVTETAEIVPLNSPRVEANLFLVPQVIE